MLGYERVLLELTHNAWVMRLNMILEQMILYRYKDTCVNLKSLFIIFQFENDVTYKMFN